MLQLKIQTRIKLYLVFLCFICFQKHISKRVVIVLNLKTLTIKFPSVPKRKELDFIQTTLCYLNLKIVLNPVVMTNRHTGVILNCVTSVYSTHSGKDQYDFQTDEWNEVTTAVLNTYKLARMNTFTFYKVHNNFYFPHSNNMLFVLIFQANMSIKNYYCKINYSKIIYGHYCIWQIQVTTSCQPVYYIHIANTANRPHARWEVKNGSCHIRTWSISASASSVGR